MDPDQHSSVPALLVNKPEGRVHILGWHIIHVIHMTQSEYDPQTVNVRHQTNFHSISWPGSRWQTIEHVTGYNEIRESWPTGFIIVFKAHEYHLWQDEVCHPMWQEAAWSANDLYKDCFWCQATDQFKISTHTLSTKLTAFIQCCLTHGMKCVKKLDLKNCSLKIISICCWPHCEFNVSPHLWTINWLTNAL